MIKSIFLKEWLKLKYFVLVLLVASLAILGYFGFRLHFLFTTIEPESMMWYQFVHLENKPYFYFLYLFLAIGAFISLVQFLPERVRNRVKIMAHLPLSMRDSLFVHLFIGIVFILLISLFIGSILTAITMFAYPSEIISIISKDIAFYTLGALIVYVLVSSITIEKYLWLLILKVFLLGLFLIIFSKTVYSTSDILWLVFFLFVPFLSLDSFYSIKQQRLDSPLYKLGVIVAILVLLYEGYTNYQQNYKKEFNHYYIFYSNVVKDFVYQKNFGEHQFEYGIKDKKTFDQYEYESYLPFVYWRNLDIQKKLPIVIDGKKFDKKIIKASRLGFGYHPRYLKPLELDFFPLLNPHSDKGMIKFPEEMFTINKNGVKIYDFDHGLNQKLVDEANAKLLEHGFEFPSKNIWGKSTNMKPFDLGYVIKDSKDQLFQLKRENDVISVTKIKSPKNVTISFMKISENRQKNLSGYAIDSQGKFYITTWGFDFLKLDLPNFDYKKMKLKLISNPLNYLIRYDDGENYYAVVYDKNFNLIKKVKF